MVAHHGGFEYFMSIGYHVPHAPFAVYTPLSNKYLDGLVKKNTFETRSPNDF